MEFLVVIHAQSAFGRRASTMLLKVGGASGMADLGEEKHPYIVCTDMDWSVPGVMQCTHLQNPGDPQDRKPQRLVLPVASLLFAVEAAPPQEASTEEQASGGSRLH